MTQSTLTQFDRLLYAFEEAVQAPAPFLANYSAKRNALLDYVLDLERRASTQDAAEAKRLTTDQQYWIDRRPTIIAALAAEGYEIWSDKGRVWLHRIAGRSSTPQDAADARRFAWYFSDEPKGWWLATYLDGMRAGWTTDQWRAAIDAAIASAPQEPKE